MGNPLNMTALVAQLPGSYYVTRQAVYSPALARKCKRAIRQAVENQKLKKGTSFVEVVSNCNSGWKMTPVKANEWLAEHMLESYPLGDLKTPQE
jgi:2-oxoglutarate ferredoxin oxidoreductase subunit beta